MREIEEKMEQLEPESLRFQVLSAVQKFKGNWLDLGRFISLVQKRQLFKEWDFSTFDGYCTRELKLRQATVGKLLKSYHFLKKEEPGYLSRKMDAEDESGEIPDYESINVLRMARAKKAISEDEYSRLRSAVLNEEAEPREVGRQYRSILQSAREAAMDPEEAWARKRMQSLKKVLSSLRTVKNTVELSHLLREDGIAMLKKLIEQVEEELMEEGDQ